MNKVIINNLYEDGQMLLINKPLEWTSFDVVKKIRALLRIRKIGHAGTLDPLATGLLIVCTGKFTKQINHYMASEKEYTGTITLGASTPTFDLESEPENFRDFSTLTDDEIYAATSQFTGEIFQMPPIHSAIKQEGKPVYKLARKGVDVKLQPRKLTISHFEITGIHLPVVSFKVICSTGTYIRSLANDFGEALGTGGYLSGLCRTRIGTHLLSDAYSVKELEEKIKKENNQFKMDS